MFTFFACPKPFRGQLDIIQRNAIKSWLLLKPKPEIILVGDEEGVAKACDEFNLVYVPGVQRNDFGTPIVSSVFSLGIAKASHQIVCYLNCDLIIMEDFMKAIISVAQIFPRFFIFGNRWDIDITYDINFSPGWEEKIKGFIQSHGIADRHIGADAMIFPKMLFTDMPPFAMGRPLWDCWMIYKFRSQRIPVIDITKSAMIIHQNHDYSHCQHGDYWKGEEVKRNLELTGGYGYVYTSFQATHKLTEKGIAPNISYARLRYGINRFLRRMASHLFNTAGNSRP